MVDMGNGYNIGYKITNIKKWLCLVICMLIISVSVSFLMSTYLLNNVYESSAILMVYGLDMNDDTALRDGRTYRTIAASNQMMGEIITLLDLEYDIKDMRSKTKVSYEEDTGLIYITVEDKDGEIAFKIVESLVCLLQERAEELFGKNDIKVVDSPYIPMTASKPNVTLNMSIAGVFAIILSTMIIILSEKRRWI